MVQTINSLGLRQLRRRTIGAVCHVESDVTKKGGDDAPFSAIETSAQDRRMERRREFI